MEEQLVGQLRDEGCSSEAVEQLGKAGILTAQQFCQCAPHLLPRCYDTSHWALLQSRVRRLQMLQRSPIGLNSNNNNIHNMHNIHNMSAMMSPDSHLHALSADLLNSLRSPLLTNPLAHFPVPSFAAPTRFPAAGVTPTAAGVTTPFNTAVPFAAPSFTAPFNAAAPPADLPVSSSSSDLRDSSDLSLSRSASAVSFDEVRSRPPVAQWSAAQVQQFVREELAMPKAADVLLENDVDGATLAEVSEEELRDLGLSLGNRKGILRAVKALRSGSSASSPVPAASPPSSVGSSEGAAALLSIPSHDIVVQHELSRGAFGVVYYGLWHGKTPVALKKIQNAGQISEFLEEINMLRRASHPAIVTPFGTTADARSGELLLVTEFFPDGSLLSWLRRVVVYDESVLCRIGMEIAVGMEHLMRLNILHRDLAARNCLVRMGPGGVEVKISDFGLARLVSDSNDYYKPASEAAAIPFRWSAPECLTHKKFTVQSEVWSFGVTLWEIFTLGAEPYADWLPRDILSRLQAGERLAAPPKASAEVYAVMHRCWSIEPSERPNFSTLFDLLTGIISKRSSQSAQNTNQPINYM